ncbi:DUF2516 family protein [Gordonia sp. (in: high G+C Gram-positive bacteria)]|uniref:DUF2516 family protein n=1 Tax=Gordonia sp. (in: high G+C Gram-positive bacteria) TaxID=84139 RepID=UPI00168E0EA2|nr:DUF2516 family protein [Gordonia sp. (in: high G+C Gram-positive bacteria)]NLG44980.1 DUF2516 family protein [Gordonia sp. (in: high G+C Gram-positive bacteria)]
MSTAIFVHNAQVYILLAITIVAGVTSTVALVHAAITRPDAFTATDAQSKTFWVSILAVSTILIWVVQAGFGMGLMFFLAAVTAMLVYVVDVRVRIDGVLGRSWFRKNA